MVATSVFLPYEVYDLTVKITWLRVGALVINLVLVVYLVWSKRLFGARGGKRAYEARLRTDSFIEVEQAALAATRLAEQLTVPAERPSLPAERPTVPAERPTMPAERPTVPAERPTMPAERPTVPDGKLPPRPTMLRAVRPAQGDPVGPAPR
jgi:hypothetical protein